MIKNIPNIGLGTWKVKGQDVIDSVIKAALESGYRHIDTANVYQNEIEIGNALKKLKVNRDMVFITSKIWPNNFDGKKPTEALEITLKNLQIKQIDLMLLHAPFVTDKMLLVNAFKQLMKARDENKIRYIGVSNFAVADIELIKKETGEYPYVNQIISAPTIRLREVEKFCQEHKIKLTGYSTLRTYFNPNPFYPGSGMNKKQKARIDEIAKKYNKDPGQILSRWSLQNDYSIIPKSARPERVKSNILIEDFKLSNEEMTELNSWNTVENDNQILKTFADLI